MFNRFAGQPEKVLGSCMSALFDGGLRLWADPDVRDATAATDFWITDFRSDPASVFLCVSQKDLGVLSLLIRLMFQQMFTLLQETDRTEEDRFDVLFLLDEFASLGKMQGMGRAITTARLGPEPELAETPRSTLLGGEDKEAISRAVPIDGVGPQAIAERVPMNSPATDTPLVRLGIVQGKQVDLISDRRLLLIGKPKAALASEARWRRDGSRVPLP